MRHPIWFVNMCSISQFNRIEPLEYTTLLWFWSGQVNSWMDNTLIKGNKDAQAVVRVLHKLYFRQVDWMRLTPPNDGLVVKAAKRLNGALKIN
jgi:hypothetical protein